MGESETDSEICTIKTFHDLNVRVDLGRYKGE